jgi:hypothetical protein
MRYKVEERPTRLALLLTLPILTLQVGPRWSPSISLLLHLCFGVLNGEFSSSLYSPPRVVFGRVIQGNLVNRLGEGVADLLAKTKRAERSSRFGRPLVAASHAAFHPGHCQVGSQVGIGWLALSLAGFLLFVVPKIHVPTFDLSEVCFLASWVDLLRDVGHPIPMLI